MIPVVDKNDIVIGRKKRDELSDGDIWRISAVWILNSEKQSLIAQRKLTKKVNPGKWGPAAAGTVEVDETYETNAYKELEEELGVKNQKLTPLKKFFYHEPSGNTYRWCQPYKLVLDWPLRKFSIQEDEVEKIDWIDTKIILSEIKNKPDKYVASASVWAKMFDL